MMRTHDGYKEEWFLIAGGNKTLLVWGCPVDDRLAIAQEGLARGAEQVGFVEEVEGVLTLTMMGGELCINATLALASKVGQRAVIQTSGVREDITAVFDETSSRAEIEIPLGYEKHDDLILFNGIGYAVVPKSEEETNADRALLLRQWAQEYQLPAFGIVIYENSRITPYVFVAATDSLVCETSCGSGSVAFSLISGVEEVVQPTGESIRVRRTGPYTFSISASIASVSES